MLPLPAMLDPRIIRERRDEIVQSCRIRHVKADVDAVLAEQEKTNALLTELNEANRTRNEHQKSGQRKMEDHEREAHKEEGRALKEKVAGIEERLREKQAELDTLLMQLPNFVHPSVPEGGEDEFRVIEEGTPKKFDFEPLDHLALCEKHDLVDFESAAKVSGQKFYYLKNEAALLDLALQRMALDMVMAEGFTPLATPDLARPAILSGLGFNPRGEESQIYSIENHDLCLVGTAEVPMTALHAGEILSLDELPLRFVALSTCYRREAGTHGKDTRGLYRVHQFQKVEQVVVDVGDEDRSLEHHREILANAEEVLQALELPYRVVNVCGGDLGAPQVQKFDIETWMPSRESYGETHSASRFHEFQARRLGLRYRGDDGKVRFCHTLNNTVAASARMLIALLENHQCPDGTVRVPPPLRPYLAGRESLGRPLG